jgi:hypothetical protein
VSVSHSPVGQPHVVLPAKLRSSRDTSHGPRFGSTPETADAAGTHSEHLRLRGVDQVMRLYAHRQRRVTEDR